MNRSLIKYLGNIEYVGNHFIRVLECYTRSINNQLSITLCKLLVNLLTVIVIH